MFVLNHKQPLTLAAPPVAPIADEARRQGALLDLDKHSWPWSIMLVPIMDVDLFELSNNHVWRTEFAFKDWTIDMLPQNWNIETDQDGYTEWGWIDFGFKSYYALLNCGFKMRPSAGTASGVHPVPLGYGRVYVECPDGFTFDRWTAGLDAGRSFVTTGPMLFARVNDQPPGSTIKVDGPTNVRVHGSVEGKHPLKRIEIVAGGRVVDVVPAKNDYESPNVFRTSFDVEVPIDTTSWVAVRCFEDRQGIPPRKMTFAHSSPVHIEMPGRPLRPRKIETDYFIRRMNEEIERSRDVLRPDELAEYERARDVYAGLAERAIDDADPSNADLRSLVVPTDQLPNGWEFTDVSDTEMSFLGTNPKIVSRPDVLGGFPGPRHEQHIDECNVVRSLLALYRHPVSQQHAFLSAHVCADDASAEYMADVTSSPPNQRGRFRSWQHGNLAICLAMPSGADDKVVSQWADLVQRRVQQLR